MPADGVEPAVPMATVLNCPNQTLLSDVFFTPSTSVSSIGGRFCRICHLTDGELIRPCRCCGSIANVHEKCLETWAKLSKCERCQVCWTTYAKTWPRLKPFQKWEKPPLTILVSTTVVLILLTYHLFALYYSCFRYGISKVHLVVYIVMLATDLIVFSSLSLIYLHGQSTQRYTNRKRGPEPAEQNV